MKKPVTTKVVIIGAGAIGGFYGSLLAKAGVVALLKLRELKLGV